MSFSDRGLLRGWVLEKQWRGFGNDFHAVGMG